MGKSTAIPGVTDNKKGLLKLLGLIMITGVLNQRKFIFDSYNQEAFELLFEDYSIKYIERWWFTFASIIMLFSIFIINKLPPVFFFGVVSLLASAGQFVAAFNDGDKTISYGVSVGISGGIAYGSLVVAPLIVIWENFPAKAKPIVTGFYFFLSSLLSDVAFYWAFRSIWWRSLTIPSTAEDKKA